MDAHIGEQDSQSLRVGPAGGWGSWWVDLSSQASAREHHWSKLAPPGATLPYASHQRGNILVLL